jgi:iron complex transport system permease protein
MKIDLTPKSPLRVQRGDFQSDPLARASHSSLVNAHTPASYMTSNSAQSLLSSSAAYTPSLYTERGRGSKILLCVLLLIGAFVASLALGSVQVPLGDVVTILLGGEGARATWTTIVLDFRLPKAITALLAGAALGTGGLLMQTLFRNPLADPYVLGVSSGASLGVAIVILATGAAGTTTLLTTMTFTGDLSITLAASIGAALVLALVLLVGARVRHALTLLILGLMFGYAVSAVVSILMHFSIPERVQAYVNWTFGSFGTVTWSQLGVLALAVGAGLLLAAMRAKPLDALLLGETYARSMGVDVRRARLLLIAAAALLAGAVTAFCGPIGFLGIAIPHIARMIFRSSAHALLLPACALLGATLALIADMVAQLPGTQALLPLNAVTALIGAPVVVWLLLRKEGIRRGVL